MGNIGLGRNNISCEFRFTGFGCWTTPDTRGGGELRLSVHHAGHHARAVRVAAAAGQDGARVSVWALLLVPELVVVCAEPAAAVSARVGFLT